MQYQLLPTAPYFTARSDYDSARAVILGVPLDVTVSYRPGTRLAPRAIREISGALEDYSPSLDADFNGIALADLGDLSLPLGKVRDSLDLIEAAAGEIFSAGKLPFFIGGEHLMTLPLVKAAAGRYPNLAVLHFDAHADLRDTYGGLSLSHATVMRRVAEVVGPRNLCQGGIRSGDREEFAYGRANTLFYPGYAVNPLEEIRAALSQRPVYLTFDIDVVDPAYAPGTGTPEPGGCTAREALGLIYALRDLNVVAFDLVEVCPPYDSSGITAVLAAKIIREAILAFARPPLGVDPLAAAVGANRVSGTA